MKMIKKIGTMVVLLCSLFLIKDVKAGNLDTNIEVAWIPNTYANRKVGGLNYYNQMGYIYANGVFSYCLESTKFITENTYHSTTDFSSKLTNEQKDYIELIAYYGYGYQGDNSKERYLAAQELIWEYLEGVDIYFTTESKGNGTIINVDDYKEQILSLINTHHIYPSFKNNTYQGWEGVHFSYEDKNHVLDRYELVGEHPELKIEGYSFYFTPSKYGSYTYTMHLKTRNPISILYFKDDSQLLGSFGLSKRQEFTFTVVSDPREHELKLQKIDSVTGNPIKQAGIEFKIKNVKTNTYIENGRVYTTDNDGVIYTSKIPTGKYQIEEITPPKGYYKVPNKIITIDANTPSIDKYFYIEFGNTPFRSRIKIKKTGDRIQSINQGKITYQPEVLENIHFDIIAKEDINVDGYTYYQANEVVDRVVTDQLGLAISKDLPYGKYCLLETETLPEFEKNKTCEEVILNKPQTTEIEITTKELHNERKKTSLQLYKEGEVLKIEDGQYHYDKKFLKEIKFKLYAGEDIVEHGRLLLKKNEFIKEVETDVTGKILIENLPYGTYILKEDIPEEYQEEEPLTFTFDPQHPIQTISVLNKLKKGSVWIKKIDEETHQPLSGVTIGIYNKDGELVYRGITNEDGIITLDDLAYGNYYIKEITPLSTYERCDKTYSFTLNQENPSYTITLTNKKIEYPNTATSIPVSFLKSILVFILGIGLLRRYLS